MYMTRAIPAGEAARAGAEKPAVSVQDTGETETIAGYPCEKFIATLGESGAEVHNGNVAYRGSRDVACSWDLKPVRNVAAMGRGSSKQPLLQDEEYLSNAHYCDGWWKLEAGPYRCHLS